MQMDVVVRFADLDPYGHVNHARYLSYFEAARIEVLDQMGFGMMEMQAMGFHIVLVELVARYHAPSGLHDVLNIHTRVGEVRRAPSAWHQRAQRGDDLIASLDVKAAFTTLDGRPSRAPEGFSQAAATMG
jgi:YbgC/YbaW family acyl-CoA thioester hydrolase